jgi:uncharacterized protein (TIGR00725 family)
MNSNRLLIVGVIGPSKYTCEQEVYDFGLELGKTLAKLNVHVVCGGLEGIMEAVCRGFSEVKRKKGQTIGIIPSDRKSDANKFCDIIIPTGMGISRNIMIINTADILISVAGGAGTLSEIAFAWQKNKQIFCCTQFDGWAKDLAGKNIDNRRKKILHPVHTLKEIKEEVGKFVLK